jgi:imidazole glycerol phosphate synthase subunit HisF
LLYTDVARDGTEQGPNVEDTADLVHAVGMPVLASGGVASVHDLVRLAQVPGVEGTVVGRALYTSAIDLGDALRAVASSAGSAGAAAGGRQGGARHEARDDRRKGGEAPLRGL